MLEFELVHGKPECFYDEYERKGELHRQTHYCPGCGHGVIHKLLAEAIDELGIRDRTILVSPVGCSVFAYYYFDVGNIQAAHGRAPAAATAAKRARPGAIVLSYQGDGDLAAIGTAEIIHAANRGEPITCLFVNNAIYGMTGGQMAPTTPLGKKSTTTPYGRNEYNDGYPLKMAELLATLEAPVYIERVELGNARQILQARKAIRKAIECQVKGLGFSLVEILSPCPTIWKMEPVDAKRFVHDSLAQLFPPGVKCDRTATAAPRPEPAAAPALRDLPALLDIRSEPTPHGGGARRDADWRVRVAGFGGQGVLLLGQLLAEAGMEDGLEVSWLPAYGPEMRSGTSNCHVRLCSRPIDSPMVTRPNVLLAMNEPSLRKFWPLVQPGGLVLYNGPHIPDELRREDLRVLAWPFAEEADTLGSAKAGNIVMLGALLELTQMLPEAPVDAALRRLVRDSQWLEIDRRALSRGRSLALEVEEVCNV